MNDFYTFIVCSTINAETGTVENKKRFEETIETLDSIKRKVENVRIVFVDNSLIPLTDVQKQILESKSDICDYIQPNLFISFTNGVGSKGMGEAYLLFHSLLLLEKYDLIGKRIFKLSARYKLADSFDIMTYDNTDLYGKYCFRINDWDVSLDNFVNHRETITYFETRLFSFCHTLFYEYADIIKSCFMTMIQQFGKPMCNWERCHYTYIPHEKVLDMKPIHVEGTNAENGVYRFE